MTEPFLSATLVCRCEAVSPCVACKQNNTHSVVCFLACQRGNHGIDTSVSCSHRCNSLAKGPQGQRIDPNICPSPITVQDRTFQRMFTALHSAHSHSKEYTFTQHSHNHTAKNTQRKNKKPKATETTPRMFGQLMKDNSAWVDCMNSLRWASVMCVLPRKAEGSSSHTQGDCTKTLTWPTT